MQFPATLPLAFQTALKSPLPSKHATRPRVWSGSWVPELSQANGDVPFSCAMCKAGGVWGCEAEWGLGSGVGRGRTLQTAAPLQKPSAPLNPNPFRL